MSKTVNEAGAVWQGNMKFEGSAGSGFSLAMDAAPEAGGENGGFRPMELLLVGLAGCTAMDVLSILKKKRQDVTGFEVKVKGGRADDHPKVYTDIEIEYIVAGRGVDPKAVERAIELSETRYCGAQATLKHTADIRMSYTIHEV
ncbi:MAG: OsmC family protein [Anaerolineae bacterium]|nr:OsmC family protein [Anaerolineae bacterium]